MSLARRGRVLGVLGLLLPGAVGIISSTQTWLTVERADATEPILISGAATLVLLAPLSLAVLALGGALSIAGKVLRTVLALLALGAAAVLGWSTLSLLIDVPTTAVGPAVADATGIAGGEALDEVVAAVVPTSWPAIALVGWVVLLLASAFILITGRGWTTGGRRYRTETVPHDGPVDAVDSWDDLSHGTDPTR